jgi:hypothetical protein
MVWNSHTNIQSNTLRSENITYFLLYVTASFYISFAVLYRCHQCWWTAFYKNWNNVCTSSEYICVDFLIAPFSRLNCKGYSTCAGALSYYSFMSFILALWKDCMLLSCYFQLLDICYWNSDNWLAACTSVLLSWCCEVCFISKVRWNPLYIQF